MKRSSLRYLFLFVLPLIVLVGCKTNKEGVQTEVVQVAPTGSYAAAIDYGKAVSVGDTAARIERARNHFTLTQLKWYDHAHKMVEGLFLSAALKKAGGLSPEEAKERVFTAAKFRDYFPDTGKPTYARDLVSHVVDAVYAGYRFEDIELAFAEKGEFMLPVSKTFIGY